MLFIHGLNGKNIILLYISHLIGKINRQWISIFFNPKFLDFLDFLELSSKICPYICLKVQLHTVYTPR